MKGIVLDLRNDPGGLLNGAVAVSAAFLPAGSLVVYTDGRTEDSKMKLNARPEDYLRGRMKDDYNRRLPADAKTVPMVVLVNGGSASASEIVAGALQDHKRAVIMGQPPSARARCRRYFRSAQHRDRFRLRATRRTGADPAKGA
jgi:carboxyl-terminal processing protease